jgi:hypothetical protein
VRKRRGLTVCATFHHSGEPAPLALADWLEELAVFCTARHPRDSELANQMSLAVENCYLVCLALSRHLRDG